MTDLRDDLQRMAERGTPIGSEELRQRVALELAGGRLVTRPERRRLLPGPVLAGLVAAVLLVLIGGAALLLGPFGDVDDVAEPVPTTAPTTVTSTPSSTTIPPATTAPPVTTTNPAEALAPLTWTRFDEEVVYVEVNGEVQALTGAPSDLVAYGPDGYVAVATRDGLFGGGLSWTSTDGVEWTPGPQDEGADRHFAGQGWIVVEDLVAAGPGYVAVGWDNPEGERSNAAVWVSSDGVSWTRIADADLTGSALEPTGMGTVVEAGPGLVGVGSDVWVSADALEWVRAGENLPTGINFTVVDPATGRMVVFIGDSEAWISDDGLRWERLGDLDPAMSDIGFGGVAAGAWGDDRILVAGWFSGPGELSIWVSPDGTSWARETTSNVFTPEAGRFYGVDEITFDGIRFILSGRNCNLRDEDCRPVTWHGVPGG